MPNYPVADIERKWQEQWRRKHAYRFDIHQVDRSKKCYCLVMFSYPSGERLHIGHWFNFGPTDTWARFQKMRGFQVFEPMGFDAFGLPAEEHAHLTGVHPRTSTLDNIAFMEEQLHRLGAMYDWDYEVVTCEPDYYRWTQWLFLKLYEQDLAYQADAPVNFCAKCDIILANEQINDGKCSRCQEKVQKKYLKQWFFRITKYGDELLEGLNDIDWPEKTKAQQRNWIGRSEGMEVVFPVEGTSFGLLVYSARPETLSKAAAIVVAPEKDYLAKLTTREQEAVVNEYCQGVKELSDIERSSTTRPKSGVFTGSYALNPLTDEKLPIYVGDYVLPWYATGCTATVPSQSERDREFALSCGLKIIDEAPALTKSLEQLKKEGLAKKAVHYRLRDWLVSRQRYWGAPIPIIHCQKCGPVPVPEDDLPILLPDKPETKEHLGTSCPKCREPAFYDSDTMDTFVCSSWYYLRYPCVTNHEEAFSKDIIETLLPVDKYVGGAEHACLHLLYARFVTKALSDMGYLSFREPFWSLTHQGPILGADGRKMAKNHDNVVSPETFVNQYGSDIFRNHLMFAFAYDEGGRWDPAGLKAIERWFDRVWRWFDEQATLFEPHGPLNEETLFEKEEKKLRYVLHHTIRNVTIDTAAFKFNTAISRLMELTKALYEYTRSKISTQQNEFLLRESAEMLIRLLAPYAPHLAEELWEQTNHEGTVFAEQWPEYNEEALKRKTCTIVIQINGKTRTTLEAPPNASDDELASLAKDVAVIKKHLAEKVIDRTIVVKDRLINFVLHQS